MFNNRFLVVFDWYLKLLVRIYFMLLAIRNLKILFSSYFMTHFGKVENMHASILFAFKLVDILLEGDDEYWRTDWLSPTSG